MTNPTPFRAASYRSWDAQLGYRFSSVTNRHLRGLQLTVGVNNVFNDYPPLIPSEGNQSRDINPYGPIGRFVYVQARYKF